MHELVVVNVKHERYFLISIHATTCLTLWFLYVICSNMTLQQITTLEFPKMLLYSCSKTIRSQISTNVYSQVLIKYSWDNVERKNLPKVWHTTEQDWNSGWLSRESEALATAPLSNAPMHQCTNAPMRHCCFATMRKIVWIKPARRGLFVASCPVDLARSVHRCVTDSRGATTHSPLERESGETE
jgi:hypothetical protein